MMFAGFVAGTKSGDQGLVLAAFVRSLEVCVAQIERNPELWPQVDGETRRGRLRRFPYVLYYELRSDDILILAIWHGRRDPHGWRGR